MLRRAAFRREHCPRCAERRCRGDGSPHRRDAASPVGRPVRCRRWVCRSATSTKCPRRGRRRGPRRHIEVTGDLLPTSQEARSRDDLPCSRRLLGLAYLVLSRRATGFRDAVRAAHRRAWRSCSSTSSIPEERGRTGFRGCSARVRHSPRRSALLSGGCSGSASTPLVGRGGDPIVASPSRRRRITFKARADRRCVRALQAPAGAMAGSTARAAALGLRAADLLDGSTYARCTRCHERGIVIFPDRRRGGRRASGAALKGECLELLQGRAGNRSCASAASATGRCAGGAGTTTTAPASAASGPCPDLPPRLRRSAQGSAAHVESGRAPRRTSARACGGGRRGAARSPPPDAFPTGRAAAHLGRIRGARREIAVEWRPGRRVAAGRGMRWPSIRSISTRSRASASTTSTSATTSRSSRCCATSSASCPSVAT